ncbi:hypothetical protein Tco_1156290 [Tanacetum coccineum]
MDDPNITMEEYIMLEEEKAQKRGKVFNWETAKYGKIWYDEDIHDLRSVETEFPTIAFNDGVSYEKTLSCEPTVSSLNNEIDFRISFDDSDNEDYMYTDVDILDFESRLTRIYKREVHRVHVFDFGGLPDLMADGLSARMLMEHRDAQGVSLFTSQAWRQLFDIRGPLIGISSAGDFLDTAPSYTAIRDPILSLCHRYLRLFTTRRKSGAHISGGQFVARLARHFGLLTEEILHGSTVIAPALPVIDMAKLVVAAGAPKAAPAVDEGGQADPAPVQAPQQPPPPPPPADAKTMPHRMAKLEEDVREIRGTLTDQGEVIDGMARDFSRFSTWAVTILARMMDSVTYTSYSETPREYQRRRVRQRTGEASISTSQQDQQQPDL